MKIALAIILLLLGFGGGYYLSRRAQPIIPITNDNQTPPVVIPNQPSAWKTYTNDQYGIQISYPPTSTLKTADINIGASWINSALAEIDLNIKQPKTNLSQALVLVSATSSPSALAFCDKRLQSDIQQPLAETITINGVQFKWGEFTDAAAGNLYTSRLYRTVKNRVCYEINLLVHSTNVGNYEPGTITEFDPKPVNASLQAILNTVKFNF